MAAEEGRSDDARALLNAKAGVDLSAEVATASLPTVHTILSTADRLRSELTALGIEIVPSFASFYPRIRSFPIPKPRGLVSAVAAWLKL